jgi:excisionase family DNA binding protein
LKQNKKLSKITEVMYTSLEAAKLLGVSPRTIQLWTDNGILKAQKTSGGHRRFPESVLEEFLNSQNTDCVESADDPPKPATATVKSGELYRVLVAEDEPDLRTLYESTMESWGLPLSITTVKDGYDALIRLGADQPDMLIVDLNLPKIDGFHMINAVVNESRDMVKSEIVVITALSKNDIINRGGLPNGVTIYHKPIPFTELQLLIKAKIAADKKSSH